MICLWMSKSRQNTCHLLRLCHVFHVTSRTSWKIIYKITKRQWIFLVMKKRSSKSFLQLVPGEAYLGKFRFLPFFFLAGAGLEYLMIHWRWNDVNFYNTYKKRQAKNYIEDMLYEYDIDMTSPIPISK